MNSGTYWSLFGWLAATLVAVSSASAQQRTFVSGLGSDSNPCSRAAPCRTFSQAISQTNAGGEVYVLDTAGYGPFTITKSVAIVAPQGVTAGISVFSGDGIDINAGASDTVILRGLTVNNQGSGGSGIVFKSGGTLHVEGCVANGFSASSGIAVTAPGNIFVFVTDTIARGNLHGFSVDATASGLASVALDHVHLDGNGADGLILSATGAGVSVNAAIRNSSASGNTDQGMSVVANS